MPKREKIKIGRLITEVRKRPALYMYTGNKDHNKIKRSKNWEEVCESVVFNWNNLNESEKIKKVQEVQRRWKSLRDCFRRELKLQSNQEQGTQSTKRKYIFYDELLFLIPFMDKTKLPNNVTMNEDEDATSAFEEVELLSVEKSEVNFDGKIAYPGNDDIFTSLSFDENRRIIKEEDGISESIFEETQLEGSEITDSLAGCSNNVISSPAPFDEDKLFLMSLWPSFKKMKEDEKFTVRIEIMRIVQKILCKNK